MTQHLDWRETLAALIAENSISSGDATFDHGNRGAAEGLAERLDGAGFDCDMQPLPGRDDKVNLSARIGGSAEAAAEHGLVLAGHIDTVPYDAGRWTSDPFVLTERDDKLYGLGVTDMKGFVALAADAAAEYVGRELKAPITLLASADEECGMDGARALLDRDAPRPGRHCLIGEPTGLTPIHRHKGILLESIITHGASGHSSNPAHGANAIDAMHRAISAIHALRDELTGTANEADFPVPHATISIGAIHGGDSANRIPAECRLDMDLRFLPGMTIDGLRDELYARIRKALAGSDCSVTCRALFTGTPAFETAADAAIVKACEQLSGKAAGAVDFGTEGSFYNQMGMESVILGPGDIAQAHQPDEYLGLERIEPTQRILHGLIGQFCLD